jgi:hypothetical protein
MRSRFGAIMAGAVSLALALALALAGPALADRTLSKAQFRDRYIQRIHQIAPDVIVKVTSAEQVELSKAGAEPVSSYLFNAYGEYLKDPASLDSMIERYARLAIASMQPAGAVQLADLVILIRPHAYLDVLPAERVTRPLAEDLVEVVAINNPESFQIPTLAQLSKSLGAPDDKLWRRALENTKVLMGACSATKLSEGVIDLRCNPGFASSALLLDEIWAPHQLPGRGAAIVAVGKDDLLVAHSGAPKSVEALSGFMAARANDPDLLSQTLLVRTDTGWATYDPNH